MMMQARFVLLGIFLLFLIALLALAYATGASNRIFPDEATALMTQILAIYSIHLAVICGSIFGENKVEQKSVPSGLLAAAIALSITWNLLLLGGMIAFLKTPEWKLAEIRSYLDTIAKSASFLVAGMLAFFFAGARKSVKPGVRSKIKASSVAAH